MLPDFLGELRPQLETYTLDYGRMEAPPLQPGDSLTGVAREWEPKTPLSRFRQWNLVNGKG